MPTPTRIILDVDTGIDDALAIVYALKRPGVSLEAVTTSYGNTDLAATTRNTLQILEAAGRPDIPVAAGCSRSLTRPFVYLGDHIHGANGLGNVALPPPRIRPVETWGPDLIIEMARREPGAFTLVPVGPMTNTAQALMKAPDIAGKLAAIVPMGGTIRHPGVPKIPTPMADANFFQDPEAARILLQSGARIRMVGMDVTMQTRLTAAMMDDIAAAGDRVSRIVMEASRFYLGAYQAQYPDIDYCALHDPLAVEVACNPDAVTLVPMQLDVECAGELTRGQVIPDLRQTGDTRPNAEVAMEVDAGAFQTRFGRTLAEVQLAPV